MRDFFSSRGYLMRIGRIVVAGIFLLAAAPASAVDSKQLIEGCRESVGRPIFAACMKAGGGSMEACREKARPKVQACVQAAMEKSLSKQANPRTPPPLRI